MIDISTQSYKGVRDFYPDDLRIQKAIFSAWSSVAERYGYEKYDASVLEPLDLYRLKNQSNQEIVDDQMYAFVDRGNREVALRPEMTPTVSRMVAGRRQELAYPLRWYSIPNLFRYERPQKGRLREHWQLNVDIFGVDAVVAEQELIMVANDIFKEFGASSSMYRFKLNNRRLMDFALSSYLGLDDTQVKAMMRLIDAKAKMSQEAFVAAAEQVLSPSQRESNTVAKLDQLLTTANLEDLPEEVKLNQGYEDLAQLLNLLKQAGVENAEFDIGVMRGFDYYTGNVFEVFDTNPENPRSIFGGGRYDGLVGAFGVEPVPTVGFGFGDVTFREFLVGNNLLMPPKTETDVYVVLVGDVYEQAQDLLQELRSEGVNVAVDFSNRKIGKQIDVAAKKGIRYVLFLGPEELENGQFKLKNIETGEELTKSLARVISLVKAV